VTLPADLLPEQARRARATDLALWSLSAAYVVMTLLTGWPAYEVWAAFALAPCVLGAAQAAVVLAAPQLRGVLSDRRAPLLASVATSLLALVHLARERAAGDVTASLSEVRVIERMARELMAGGTPYVDVAWVADPAVFDYSPYTPAMAVFGLPAALWGSSAWTDPRIYCLLLGGAAVLAARRLRPTADSLLGWQLLLNPLVLLMVAASGTDIGVLGLIVLGLVLAGSGRVGWAGCCLGLAVGMKLTAAPVLVIAGALVAATLGRRLLLRYAAAAGLVTALVDLPVYAADPEAFVQNVIAFPAGLTEVASSAASPLPGHLIAQQGDAGRTLALALLAATALAVGAWVVLRPPTSTSAALLRTAAALGAAMLVLPASRFGYAIYPLALCGAALLWSRGGPGQDVGIAPLNASSSGAPSFTWPAGGASTSTSTPKS
jgi:hypothetical protein